MQKIVLATSNPGKVRELATLLTDTGLQIIAQREFNVSDAEETGLTFIENAIIKARHAAQYTGLAAIADDSGLAVDYLNGKPGIYSARYAGVNASDQQNRQKLLQAMQPAVAHQRSASFHCVLVYLRSASDPTPLICHGQWQGEICHTPRGDAGFGYDPLFFIPHLNKTAAELNNQQKNALSHRGQALRSLLSALRAEYAV